MHFFTSITSNYLPKARVLATSVKKHNPDAVFHLMLCDTLPEGVNPADEPFDSIIRVEDLNIPNPDAWMFRHTVVEMCTAVKGAAFVHILETKGAEKAAYLDPDIAVLSRLDELENLMDSHSVILTPHQVMPESTTEAILDNEICSLKHGIYNLGFLAVRNSGEGLRFVKWWRDRLLEFCYDDIPNGLFTDQRWADLAPAFFDDILILRDKTYNVATWNLTHRDVRAQADGTLTVDGSPVKFYHFSGFDSGAQETMLGKYAGKNDALLKLRQWYIGELDRAGQEKFGKLPCVYSFYSNGETITKEQRLIYRSRLDVIRAFPKPAVVTDDKLCYYWWFQENGPAQDSSERVRELLAKERELERLLNSRSWKITRPLRYLGRKIREYLRNNPYRAKFQA